MAERKPHSLSEPLDDAIGPLRHKLAKPELARVNDVARRGLRALLLHARELDVRAAADAQRLRALTAALEREPNRARPLIEQYLTETAPSPEALRADRRALSAGESSRLNLATLAERVATKVFRIELECELALAVLRSRCHEPEGSTLDVQAIASLALRPGRWSRRAEAFALLRTLAQSALPAEARRQILDACLEGARLEQHRWVQVAAVEAMAGLDAERALALVRDRLAHPQSGDDFLVRERFVELAARLPHDTWHVVLEAGAKDTSEHVRLTAARTVRDPAHLAHMATRAESDKVRALALVSLAKRTGASAQPTLIAALASDRSPLAVEAAAEALVLLARRNVLRDRKPTEEALARTAARMDLPSRTRAVVLEELSTLAVLATPYLRLVHDLVASAVAEIPVGGSGQLVGQALSGVSEEEMGRLLSALSRGDFGLCAERISDGYIVHRGEARAFSSWRWLFELLHPLPTKRQGYTHTWARRVRGQLRAPPQGLAELSATAVPGERLLVGARGDWGRHLPLVDDLLHTGVFFPQPARIVSPQGTTIVTPPDSLRGRLAAWAQLSLHYAGFAKQRHRSLDSDEPAVQRGFVDSVQHETGIRIDFVPHPFTEGLPKPAEFGTGPIEPASAQSPQRAMTSLFALPTLSAFRMFDGLARDFFHYSVSPEGNRLPHVGAYAATLLVGMIARGVVARRRIDADRKAIPLVVGGWGTRGKSGTERLKAGLFQGLGYEVLVKTTGCEAMFIHGIPGLRAQEVFIYRPYDKATVWEQRSLLRLARRFDVQVFLWECMALQPDLVNLLQAQWMRDDYSTITNAYPDHEDIQGPAGYDVAETISEFVPTGGRLFTTEDQMLPLLRERAKARGTSVRAIPPREASLIGDDILARFPYQEHPNNIALVSALAQALGVSASVALAEMADHVVPDLGVLKTYPPVRYLDRSVAFTNGMSANEITGASSNWIRAGFDLHEVDNDPSRRIVNLVNNRADRVARSEVFARFIVQDAAAHKHVIIGTNVSGFVGFAREALAQFLVETAPSRDLAGDLASRRQTVSDRLHKAWQRLKIGAATPEAAAMELASLSLPALSTTVLRALLAPIGPDETVEQGRRAVEMGVPSTYPAEGRPFVVESLARRRATAAVGLAVDRYLESEPARLDAIFSNAYRQLFEDQLVPLDDSNITGDAIIDVIARTAPPGTRIDIMGLQNIKGTGLDFVYRWVSLDAVERAIQKMRSTRPEERDEGLHELLTHNDWGLIDASHALRTLESLREGAPREQAAMFDAARTHIGPIEARHRHALGAARSRSVGELLRGLVGQTFDYLDSMRRQSMAKRVVDDLVASRISHAGAAIEMRAIVARAKGRWANKTSAS